MENVSRDNALIITNYIMTLKVKVNISDSYRKDTIRMFCAISRFFNNKPFKEIARDDNPLYLYSCQKPENIDPLHK
jgi:hypothetical protein